MTATYGVQVDCVVSLKTAAYELWDKDSYAELRDLTVSWLTLSNARRGGEPTRMLLSEWKEAEKNVWLREKEPASDLVPVLIPPDVTTAAQILSES